LEIRTNEQKEESMIDDIKFAKWFHASTVRNAIYLQGRAGETGCWPEQADFLHHRARELLEFAGRIEAWIALKLGDAIEPTAP
jgi:hypothetical protein